MAKLQKIYWLFLYYLVFQFISVIICKKTIILIYMTVYMHVTVEGI